jgi:hypothetical protein
MKTIRRVLLVGAWVVLAAAMAHAQTAPPRQPVTRADAMGTIAWFNADKGGLDRYNDWYNRSIYGGASFGWYWTDNLKTEIDGGVSSKVELEVYNFSNINNRTIQSESTYHFATRRIAFGQQYQFYRNVWFHPFVAAGVDLTWERINQEDGLETVFDSTTRQTQITHFEVVHPPRTELRTRPFATFGFKTYMTPRSFFRTDMKLVFRGGLDELLMRFGIGVDF